MKYFKITAIVALMVSMVSISGCYYDHYPAIEGVSRDVSFSADLIPIFNASCNATGCHSAGGIPPVLTANDAYDEIINGSYVSLENPENSSLYKSMTGEISLMPPAGKLPDSEISLVLGWIQQGALDN